MWVSDVALDDYRSYAHLVIGLKPGICVFTGLNGQGKTNFVEAIAYMSMLSSHRVAKDTPLVRVPQKISEGEGTKSPRDQTNVEDNNTIDAPPSAAVIRLKAREGERDTLLDLEIISGKANRARLNRQPVRPRTLLGNLPLVIFAPEDMSLIQGDPSTRRLFLDRLIQQARPTLAPILSEQDKVLRQRAATLKNLKFSQASPAEVEAMMTVWDEQLIPLAASVITARKELLSQMNRPIWAAYRKISALESHLEASYICQLDSYIPSDFPELQAGSTSNERKAWELDCGRRLGALMKKRRSEELQRAVNLVGSHRDDLSLHLDGLPVKGYASHGETWSVALALKLASFEWLKNINSSTPVLILDDVFSKLDASRRTSLLDAIKEAEQVLITAAVKEDLPEFTQATYYRVTKGSIVEENALNPHPAKEDSQ
ncbi:MAG: DNA replication/repair protein RecF [Actinomycetaceae bacterium]|nr:DNA replication/repair protein RecF [Actinomycetaceae bacterium]